MAVLHNFAERRGIQFPLLSDRDSKVIRELGILNETIPKDSPFFGVPYPGTFVLDAQGVITAKYFEDDFRERYTSADILARQFGVRPDAGRGVKWKASSSSWKRRSSNLLVAAGQRVSLTLEIEMKPNMHVYAPGVEENYIPINWKMKESAVAAAHEVSYPPSEKLHLAAIDETVPVYRDHFRLTREITIGQDAKVRPALDSSGKFTVEGTLRYQACDDRVCYIPQELPVKWTFQYAEFDRERVPAELRTEVTAVQQSFRMLRRLVCLSKRWSALASPADAMCSAPVRRSRSLACGYPFRTVGNGLENRMPPSRIRPSYRLASYSGTPIPISAPTIEPTLPPTSNSRQQRHDWNRNVRVLEATES